MNDSTQSALTAGSLLLITAYLIILLNDLAVRHSLSVKQVQGLKMGLYLLIGTAMLFGVSACYDLLQKVQAYWQHRDTNSEATN